jgi:hypothetical protein
VFHPRHRSAPFHSSGPLLPRLFPSLPSFFLFPSFITLVCCVTRSRDRSLTSPRPVGFSDRGSAAHFFADSRRSRSCSMFRHPSTGWNLLMSGVDLLDGDTGTPTVSQQSESGQGLLCVKGDIGKYDMWYGVVCKTCRLACRELLPSRRSRHGVMSRHKAVQKLSVRGCTKYFVSTFSLPLVFLIINNPLRYTPPWSV